MVRKARASRSLDTVPDWQFIGFTDLHVSAATLERALRVLANVRVEAVNRACPVVFCGDWWDARGVLSVRQLDPIIDELKRWLEAGILAYLIPGNHDQVGSDGRLHSIRVFEAFPNIHVVTERLVLPDKRIAFIPWREDAEEQTAQFELDGEGWTIFAHAEVQGARNNQKHTAIGRVMLSQIEAHARACYCGHYHMRQQLGDRTWYLGSPFEMNFGEMGDPKGIALIQAGKLEPEWIPLDGFRKHHRVTYGVPFEVTAITDQDVVEVYAKPDQLGTEDLKDFISRIPAADVRPLPIREKSAEDAPPAFALTLDGAIDEYVKLTEMEAAQQGRELGTTPDDLRKLARTVLSELPEAKAIAPIATKISIKKIEVQNFCAIDGVVTMDLGGRGLMLLRGPVGVGKTALVDAINWGLFEETSPRKAGTHSATFRGDEVIHDLAQECAVTLELVYYGTKLGDQLITITRSKKRGKKAVVTATDERGMPWDAGGENRFAGIDYDLWRACVSLGQGATGNFVTDADKKRKDLLSSAFGLSACPLAVKFIRDRSKPIKAQLDKLSGEMAAHQHTFDTLSKSDYSEQVKTWDARRTETLSRIRASGEQATVTLQECDKQLATEKQWQDQGKAIDQQLSVQLGALGGLASPGASQFERELGAAQAERSMLAGQLTKAQTDHQRLESQLSAGSMPCPTCGKPMDTSGAEQLLNSKAEEIERITRGIHSFDSRIANARVQVDAHAGVGQQQRAMIEAKIAELRDGQGKVAQALTAFARIRANKEEAERVLVNARAQWEREEAAENPFLAQAERHAIQLESLEQQLADLRAEHSGLSHQLALLGYWEEGFGAKGLPVLVFRTVVHELELHANRFLSQLVGARLFCKLSVEGDDLAILLFEQKRGEVYPRRYEQLSGGQRRCLELAFSPFALSEMIFNRCGIRIDLLVVDELTTHLGADEKPAVCEALRNLGRGTVLVIDHDVMVQGEFDVVYSLKDNNGALVLAREQTK